MNILPYYYKLSKEQRTIIGDVWVYTCSKPRPDPGTLMFMDRNTVIRHLRTYYKTGEHMHWSDYAVLDVLTVLQAKLPKLKPDPGGKAKKYRQKQVWGVHP